MKTSKIEKSEFSKEWGKGINKVYYHNVTFEGETKSWNIGAKQENPDFLAVGEVLKYEIVDEKLRKIKRVKDEQYVAPSATSSSSPASKKVNQSSVVESTSLIRELDKYKESNLIFLDIETVRVVKELKEGTPLYDAWLYKTRYNNELERKGGEPMTPEEYFNDKAALYAVFAKVVAIVAGRINEDKLKVKQYSVSKAGGWLEEPMLREFNDDIEKGLAKNSKLVFAGWANNGFDQPFLDKRMIINGIKPNTLLDTAGVKPWEISSLDLKEVWKGSAFYPDSLIATAVALGLPSPKSKMDGSQVGEAFYAGKIKDIVEYCTADVLTTANVYRKLAGKSLVTLE